jgi:predicted AlkP superfamily pyrophosphatase or phosphodiesterase
MKHWDTGIRARIAAACAVAAVMIGVAGAAAAQQQAGLRGVVTDHVLVVSIDGLRPDIIEVYEARVLQRMLREGAYTLTARTVYPSKTLPSHTSMLTGLPPEVHGITWNNDQTSERGSVSNPTIFGLARDRGFTTAAFFSKAKLRHLQQPGTLDHTVAPRGLETFMASKTVEAATRYMRFRQPNLLFVHIAEPDAAGHSFGWLTGAYRAAVRRADAAVGQVLTAADAAYGRGNYTVIITADHGGEGRGHGTDHGNDMLIPWIAWGAGVQPGPLTTEVGTMDTAATVLWLLGIEAPAVFHGKPVTAAFTERARQLVAESARVR